MGLWRMAAGVFKDHNSIWQMNLSYRIPSHNSDINKAVIRATSHSDLCFDRRSIHRLCEWLRLSPYNLVPLLHAMSRRMGKTRNWVVALKGLYLMHNVIDSDLPCVKAIGRLPFDLSDFHDGYSSKARSWPFNEFVGAYYAFLDYKSTVIFLQGEEQSSVSCDSMSSLIARELAMLQKLQLLIDLLLQIKPQSRAAFVPLVLEVMDWIIIEIYNLYSRICRGISLVLLNIYFTGKAEAQLALNVVQKATQQGEEICEYFQFCRRLGVSHPSGFPTVDPIPPEVIYDLEKMINSFSGDDSSSDDRSRHYTNGGRNIEGLKTVISGKLEKSEQGMAQMKDQQVPDFISW